MELSISAARAAKNYREAGGMVEEEEEVLKIEDFRGVMDAAVDEVIDELEQELGLPYKLAPFQRIALNIVGQGRSVVLVSECGSGKMDVALKGALLMRKVQREERGVTIVVQPLTALMNEKMNNNITQVAVLSQAQELTCMEEDEGGDKAVLSCTMGDLLLGKFPVLIGHPESFNTALGLSILSALQKASMLLFLVVDEFHQGGEGHWSTFRPVSGEFVI